MDRNWQQGPTQSSPSPRPSREAKSTQPVRPARYKVSPTFSLRACGTDTKPDTRHLHRLPPNALVTPTTPSTLFRLQNLCNDPAASSQPPRRLKVQGISNPSLRRSPPLVTAGVRSHAGEFSLHHQNLHAPLNLMVVMVLVFVLGARQARH